MRRRSLCAAAIWCGVLASSVGCRGSRPRVDAGKTQHNCANMRFINYVIWSYRQAYGRWPSDLRQAMYERHWVSGDFGPTLVHPSIPVIPGSKPPMSYHYICPSDETPAKAIMLYPNIRDDPELFVVVRADGTMDGLSADDFERELRAVGVDYGSLPTPGKLGGLWIVIGAIATVAVAVIVIFVIRSVKMRGYSGGIPRTQLGDSGDTILNYKKE